MWCKNCNIETNEKTCPICGEKTIEDIPTEVYWCDKCHVPVMQEITQADKGVCPRCGTPMKYLTSDIRPVFPEERLLIEILLKKKPYLWAKSSVWASNNRYYVNGKSIALPSKLFKEANEDIYIEQLQRFKENNPHEFFEGNLEVFKEANQRRLDYLIDEAHNFIKRAAAKFPEENIVLSFSGGKDSTVTADLAIKALSNPSLVHIFGNTTLEFPLTVRYAERYRRNHPQAIFKIAKNNEQVFLDVCSDIGPPARMMRWCCSMFKTGPITRVINALYRNQQILTFYGIRKSESVARSKYNRIEDDAESIKIQQQTVASPIFFWKDMDIWLYILSEGIDFNEAYRLGYDRVGCWCCPNNNQRAQFLSRIYMPEASKKWREFLVDFARKIGKPDAEEYVDSGAWKARQGGNGLQAAGDVKIRFTNCTTEEHAKIYRLVRPMDDEFLNMLTPFGRVAPELGQKLLHEVLVLDVRTNVPILSVQPFEQDGFEHAVKIRTMNVKNHNNLQHMVGYQVRKFNACRKCLKCESLCKAGAISITEEGYHIDPQKCVHCKMCVTAKYLRGGCLMDKYLRTKD
ncbi:phosphoadenosine phosphosulfate reductase [Acidaminococcus fermentans]|uniref:phosphoadenosine phosphosulfate reductase domain-containing protein n=1 Tax=Acidaminococcus fermentans TaxID=905 RepID=UPI0008EBAD7E|nr:phosphoadenosine phosphosulfate reductase family protein [Acidaminococcus fermentans]SFO76258.1 phosphoadenosine phosphosulfate reductase [Acidaminococcus fermentans]